MKMTRNLAALLMLVCLWATDGTVIKASGVYFDCDPDIIQTQHGVICEYEARCSFDSTPQSYDYDPDFCEQNPMNFNWQTGWGALNSFCTSLGQAEINNASGFAGNYSSNGIYYIDITGYWNGWCYDGEFSCYFQEEAECPDPD